MFNDFINKYSIEQKINMANISLLERSVFKPTHLHESGVNEEIYSEKELCFACDREHNNRIKKIINILCNGLTETELDSVKLINNKISEHNKSWHYKLFPKNTLLMHIYQSRLIDHLLPNSQNILEIGSGSGYLALLLALKDKSVYSTDVFQPHYMFQNFLYSIFDVCNELVNKKDFIKKKGSINHIPWWKFNKLNGDEFKCDLLVMNHAICELNILSLRHVLSLTEKLGNPKIFLESTGYPRTKWSDVKMLLKEYNYELIFSGNNEKITSGVYIFKKSLIKKNKPKHVIFKKILRLIPFKFLFIIFFNEIQKIFLELIFYKRWKKLFIKKIFTTKNKYSYSEVEELFKINGWNLGNPEDDFLNKIKKI